MPDYGLPLQFGLSVNPDVNEFDEVTELVKYADQVKLDLVGIQDHPYNRQHLDTWTLLTYLAAQTTHVRFFADVFDLPMRPPAMLAKAVSSLDRITGGRVEMGLGAGAFWDAIAAMGGTRHTPAEAVDALEEAIQLMRLVWKGERSVSFKGQHYQLKGYQPGPLPAHTPQIWLGALKPRMLRLTGRLSDGWVSPGNIYVPPEQTPALHAVIDEAATAAGRKPSDVRRIANIFGVIDANARGNQGLIGSVDQWIDTLTRWTTQIGFDTFVFWPAQSPVAQVERFVQAVVPAVRAAVAQVRAGVMENEL